MASFHALARQELLEATRYYNLESPGLGDTFLKEVERALASMLEHPEAASVIRGKVRAEAASEISLWDPLLGGTKWDSRTGRHESKTPAIIGKDDREA